MGNTYDYDVAVTFAGEDRQFVEDVVRRVVDAGCKVFYDQDEQVTLWGEELTEYFPKIYEERARLAVMPVRLDATKLDGVRSTLSYLDGWEMGPGGIADAIKHKLGGTHADGGGSFNGYVPRNEHEATVLVGERPAGWEYLLFSYAMVRGVEERHERYLDHRMEFAQPKEYVPTHEVGNVVQREL